jgi:hypothetical protein
VNEFSAFTGLRQPAELRTITRAHVNAWRKHLESRALAPSSIRRKLSALSALFDYLCERNAVAGNPVDGVKRPISNNNEGSTPALGDAQARKLLDAPADDTLKGVRDRAILATLLYHGIRREETLRAARQGHAKPSGSAAFSDQGQARQGQVRTCESSGETPDRVGMRCSLQRLLARPTQIFDRLVGVVAVPIVMRRSRVRPRDRDRASTRSSP